jgi:hypothetical protein
MFSVLPLELGSTFYMFVMCDTCLQATGNHFPAHPLNVVSRNLMLTYIHGPLVMSCHAGTVMIATLPAVAKIDVSEEECVTYLKYSHVLPQHMQNFLFDIHT